MLELKREDGSSVRIDVNLSTDYSNKPTYRVSVFTKEKGKRKWKPVVNRDSWELRKQSFPDGRIEYKKIKYLEVVTEEEVLQAMELKWNELKPTLDSFTTESN